LAPPTTTSRPGRLLATLVALIVVLLIGVLGATLFQPSHWSGRFRVGKGLDISSGTTITLKAVYPRGTSSAALATDLATAQTIMNDRVNGAGFNGASVTTQTPNLINVSVPGKGV
jgi:preprotein translocase subunit SecD